MTTDPDFMDLSHLQQADHRGKDTLVGRPWVGVRFECCGMYARVYRNKEGTAYLGRCPRCLRTVRLRVGPGGTSSRFFKAE